MTLGTPRPTVDLSTDLASITRYRIASRLLPFLFCLYIANYIDRANVAYAAIGMSRDLKFSDRVFGLGAGIFFISYVALHVPGALLAERWIARRVIAASLIAWGSVTALTALIQTPTQLYSARFVLGAAESAFFPAVIVYLSRWFSHADRAKATGAFMAAIPLSSVIGSPIAGWLLGHTWFGVQGWRWVFVVEGIPAVFLGMVALFYLTDVPHEASWLPNVGRQWIQRKLTEDTPTFTKGISVREALMSRTVVLLSVVCFLSYFALYSMLFWLPSILKRFSALSDANVGLLGAMPYLAYFLAMVVNGWHSDKCRERYWHCSVPMLISTVGFLGLMMHPRSIPLIVLSLTIASVGGAYLPVFFSIPTELLSKSAAAASVGMINAVGSTAGFVGPYLIGYLTTKSGSFTAGLTLMMVSALAGALLVLFVPRNA